MVQLEDSKKAEGLAGVIAGNSSICLCNGKDETLLYRGFSIKDLAEYASYEEVAWLLLRKKLPSKEELAHYQSELEKFRELSPSCKEVLEHIPPTVNLMDALRTCCSVLGHLDPEELESDPYLVADRLIASLGSMLCYWYHYHASGKKIDLHTHHKSQAAYLLHIILGQDASANHIKCLNTLLILYAEHEFNASTFTVRTIASTLSDFYSAICGGIGALRGPLHGGANEAAIELISKFRNPDEAEKGIKNLLKDKKLIMGFGHRVYKSSDPRSKIIKEWAEKLSHHSPDKHLFAIANRIEEVMHNEKGLFPNLDFYSALALHYCGIPSFFFTPIFVFSRISGWSAHLLEQRAHNKLIRPQSNYIGEPLKPWVPLDKRNAN